MLRQIKELVDFTFILEELKSNYCLVNGRNAVPPICMLKYLLLKSIFDLSDLDIVERSRSDTSIKYLLNMTQEEAIINPSSLSKFRKLRLQDEGLMDMIIYKTIEIELKKNLITIKTIYQ